MDTPARGYIISKKGQLGSKGEKGRKLARGEGGRTGGQTRGGKLSPPAMSLAEVDPTQFLKKKHHYSTREEGI